MANLPTFDKGKTKRLPTADADPEVKAFLDKLRTETPAGAVPGIGRLIFALDATASREPTWNQARDLQAAMFEAVSSLKATLYCHLVFYRGYGDHDAECKASRWASNASELHSLMRSVTCRAGHTQIGRVLEHALRETKKRQVNALIFVGDAMEESADRLVPLAHDLGACHVPIFMLHEGNSPPVRQVFQSLASASGGAYLGFDLANIGRLRALLAGIAVFATAGMAALEHYAQTTGNKTEVLQLTSQLKANKSPRNR